MDFVWTVYLLFVLFLAYVFLQWRMKTRNHLIGYCRISQTFSQQQEQNVYSISGRVQGQEQQQRFPEAFVSVEHISIMNEMNKPPKYDDAPPSYEEAIKIAMAQNNSMETLRAEQAGVHQASSSSSVTVVQPAVPNRTTE
ncbi:uncharacterized protein LOC115884078 isoform X13 [Sitophilus oryzae]|uniref:Uncharacterized protein LOC115884078 isoform X13 n=1 Tax=Sitophilus oryzae TaxID=7048 RepID=A0A6J2Y3M1_SITOR|nr:uncharacterized protein LOC115884078 isoform X13 [Sitophilus oryzae]